MPVLQRYRLALGCLPLLTALYCANSLAEDEPASFASRHKITFKGLLMLDAANVGGLYTDEGRRNHTDVRRARIGVSGDFNKRFDAGLELDLDGDDTVELHEAVLRYRHNKKTSLEIGYLKQPFGLEHSTGSSRTRTMERSMASRAFAPDRGYGVLWSTEPSEHFIAVGVFTDEDDSSLYDISGRASYSPVKTKKTALHFGISAVYRDNREARYRIRDSGVLPDGDNFFRSGRYTPDRISTLGLEAAWVNHSLTVQAEWFRQTLTLADDTETNDPVFSGGYVKIGMILNDGWRKYSNGSFSAVRSGNGGPAIELVAALGRLNTIVEDKGDDATEVTLGVNYRFTRNLRLSAQVQNLHTKDDEGRKDKGNSILLRMQLDLSAKPGRD